MYTQHQLRRAFAMLAVGIAAAVSVAGCGGGDDEPAAAKDSSAPTAELKRGTTVRMWIMNNGPAPVADAERLIKPFERRTGVDVKVELVGWDVQFDRIRNAAVSGEGPDITQAGTTQVPFFAALGGFEDLTSHVGAIGGRAAYPEGVWNTTQVAGRRGTWAVPWFTEARAIYFRKDVLEQAGIDASTAFSDWAAMRRTLETIKAEVPRMGGKPIAPFGTPGKKAFDLVHHVMPFVWDAGGAELSEDASRATIASAEAQQGVKFFADLVRDGLADPAQLERDGTQVENQFKAGRLAVWIGGPWVLQSAEREDDDQWDDTARRNIGIAPMPAGPSGEAYTFVGGSNLMMFKSSSRKAEAAALLQYLSQDRVQRQYAALMGMFPAKAAAQKQVGRRDANRAQFLKAVEQGRTYAPIPQWGQIENAYKNRFGTILDRAAGRGGKLDDAALSAELRKAQDEADALLAQKAG